MGSGASDIGKGVDFGKVGQVVGMPYGIPGQIVGERLGQQAGRQWHPGDPQMGIPQMSEDQRQQMLLDKARAEREKDMAAGRARGEELYKEGSLGRLEEARAKEIADIIARRQSESQGFSPEEMEAKRSMAVGDIQNNQAAALRALRGVQGAAGVIGPAAAAQQANLIGQSQAARTGVERDLFLKGVEARRTGLDSLEKSIGGARAEELAKQQFNLEQIAREKMGRIGTELGYAGLGSAERGAVGQQVVGEAAARAAANAPRGGKK